MSFIPSSDVKQQDKKDKKQNQTAQVAKPITQDDDYCPELDGRKMNFEKLRGQQYLVAVNTGPRNKPKLLASTMRGPFAFDEMVEAVGKMYQEHQHHAKVYSLEKSFDKAIQFLDEGTIDYIEANWEDILFEESFEQAVFGEDEDVIQAGAIETEYNEENND